MLQGSRHLSLEFVSQMWLGAGNAAEWGSGGCLLGGGCRVAARSFIPITASSFMVAGLSHWASVFLSGTVILGSGQNHSSQEMEWVFWPCSQVSESGVHRPHVAGIHGRSNDGAYSLVLAGGYEDDVVRLRLLHPHPTP